MSGQRSGAGARIAEALREPRLFVVSVILGTELVNVVVSNVAAVIRRRQAWFEASSGLSLIAGVVATSAILIMLCDLVPKSLAVALPEAVALRLARPFSVFFALVKPFARPLSRLTGFLTGSDPARPIDAADFRALIEISRKEGVLKASQAEMIEAAFRLGHLQVRQVMVPRPDIVAIRQDATLEEALELIRKRRHSRIPVFRGDLDRIVGLLYAKDLLAQRFGLSPRAIVRDLARPVQFVPELARARQLIRRMQETKTHLAIVVDEYGGTAGVVTLEDLLEEMVGEGTDGCDQPVEIVEDEGGKFFRVWAGTPLPEFDRAVGAHIEEPGLDTIGGYVLKLFDRVPGEGQAVADGAFEFTVRRMRRHRIMSLEVRPLRGRRGGSSPRATA